MHEYFFFYSANIEYIKWDMNRPLTEVYSQRSEEYPFGVLGPVVWQSESSHRYVQGLYQLQDRLSKAFPHVLIENCASGGKQNAIQFMCLN